eukprot:TRINITY_DN4950_c0_g2_i2.p1 TRINITY_DN4950_c0_g2~~TRINITY_DN4950_c0_g2_i2.p1  ORF type:complete len:369 (+),score=62.17 TRINITY_DN4950_c0_g2_i2:95-1201(+)
MEAPGAPAVLRMMESGGSVPPGRLPERLILRSLAERYVSSLLDRCIGAADEVLHALVGQSSGADDEVSEQKGGDPCRGSRHWEDDSFVPEDLDDDGLDDDGLSELLAAVTRSANIAPKARRRPPPREAPLPASWATLSPTGRLPAHFGRAPQPWGDSRDSESSRLQRLLAYSRGPPSRPAPSCHHVASGLKASHDPSSMSSRSCSAASRPCSAPSRPSSARTGKHAPSVVTCIASQKHDATAVSTPQEPAKEVIPAKESAKGISPPKCPQRTSSRPHAVAHRPVPRSSKVPRSCWQVQRDKKNQPNECRSPRAEGQRMLRRRDAVKWRNHNVMAKFRGPGAEHALVSRAAAASLDSFGAVTKAGWFSR